MVEERKDESTTPRRLRPALHSKTWGPGVLLPPPGLRPPASELGEVSTPRRVQARTRAGSPPQRRSARTPPPRPVSASDVSRGGAKSAVSELQRLQYVLRSRFGTVLRGFRAGLDVREVGRVRYSDLASACRTLGLVGNSAKQIWTALRPGSSCSSGGAPAAPPLELMDLDAAEASNLQAFVEALHDSSGFSVERAWRAMDTQSKGFLRLNDFVAAASALGFKGDAKPIFCGLDDSGAGRLNVESFGYLQKVMRSLGSLHDLSSWTQREFGGATQLIERLELAGKTRSFSVPELAAGLTALNCPGDTLHLASLAARHEGGTHVTADALHALLSSHRAPRSAAAAAATPRRLRQTASADGPAPPPPGQGAYGAAPTAAAAATAIAAAQDRPRRHRTVSFERRKRLLPAPAELDSGGYPCTGNSSAPQGEWPAAEVSHSLGAASSGRLGTSCDGRSRAAEYGKSAVIPKTCRVASEPRRTWDVWDAKPKLFDDPSHKPVRDALRLRQQERRLERQRLSCDFAASGTFWASATNGIAAL